MNGIYSGFPLLFYIISLFLYRILIFFTVSRYPYLLRIYGKMLYFAYFSLINKSKIGL